MRSEAEHEGTVSRAFDLVNGRERSGRRIKKRKAGAARRVADEVGSGGDGYWAPGEGSLHNKIWGLVAEPGSCPDRSTKQSKTVTGTPASAGLAGAVFWGGRALCHVEKYLNFFDLLIFGTKVSHFII